MNERQKIVQQQFLGNEEAVIKRLKQVYGESLKTINKRVSELDSSIDVLRKAYDSVTDDEIGELASAFLKKNQHLTPDEARETLRSMIQSKVYRREYQTALQKQVGDVLDKMHEQEFKTVSEYLDKCYEDGFIGTMYDLQGQGIPLCFPIDQEAVTRAVQLDSKISKGLYTRLGEDVALLKKKITAQVSRGIATGMTYKQVAQQLAGVSNIGYNNAVRIARTEGHRVQVQSGMDACYKARDKGCNVVKQWDSTLDKRTRDSHAQVDGETRELDEKFSNGLRFPGDPHGVAGEVINCRCALLQRARWALGEDELETLKERAAYFGLDKADSFEDYKKKYLKAAEEVKAEESKPVFAPAKTLVEAERYAQQFGVNANYSKYNISVANAVNETMGKARETFGEKAFEHLHRIGTFPQGFSTRFKGAYVEAGNPDMDGSLWLRNVGRKDALEKLAGTAAEQYDAGYWSTPDALHTIRHELGHAIHRALQNNEINADLNTLRKSIQDERLQRSRKGDRNHKYSDWLSEYGFTNTKEFVAESVAEYLAGNPRETASKVVEILLKGK